ncbi:Oidioi.mRNA.OKI2018_I69.PAR.g13179.t1.cds [Oikopleura dioica]|uniref:Oligomycin sensitivity conferral protein n=1 Tax=Oikopleura dioica TaxID=34765 RepID=A0ABN7S3G7_OIKDI|nr:Oidioi.mRNA.OKI2018_I69.PAR.g13179.t1.cds [Oikopleura dioica]
MFTRQIVNSARAFVYAPIPTYGIAGSYAAALYSAAKKGGDQAGVQADVQNVAAAFAAKQEVADFFANPCISAGQKISALSAVGGEAGFSQTTVGLFEALCENNRMNLFSEVAEVYARILQAEAGEVPVEIASAIELTSEQKAEVAEAVASMLGNQTPVISSSVDSSLLGGMTVALGDKYTDMKFIDMSVANKVKKYTDLLRQNA